MTEQLVPQESFKNRQTLLLVFGILEIFIGCLTACMALVTIVVPFLPKVSGHETPSIRLLLPGILLYAGLSVSFIWLGIGSIMCKRWARALLLIMGWLWLTTGLMTMSSMIITMPQMMAHQPELKEIPSEARTVILLVSIVFGSINYVLIPAAIVLFYKSPHVKATCEAIDPVTRWTDACPLPVLALSVLTMFSAISMAGLALSFRGLVPFFGTYITGIPAIVITLMISAVYIFASLACYKLQVRGWWTTLIAYSLSALSFSSTFAIGGVYHMYELMELPASQLATLKEMNFMQNPLMLGLAILYSLPFFAFLFYTKRYFKTA